MTRKEKYDLIMESMNRDIKIIRDGYMKQLEEIKYQFDLQDILNLGFEYYSSESAVYGTKAILYKHKTTKWIIIVIYESFYSEKIDRVGGWLDNVVIQDLDHLKEYANIVGYE